MIRKGFIRDEGGDWYTLKDLDHLSVTREPEQYPGDVDMCWQIEAFYNIHDNEVGMVIKSGFTHPEDAHNALDYMMKDKE